MKNLNKYDIEFLIECLKSGKEIPTEYKYALFPTKQKEYELVYAGKMRKEDVLADTEEAKPVPLQIEKVFNAKNIHCIRKIGTIFWFSAITYKSSKPLMRIKTCSSKIKLKEK